MNKSNAKVALIFGTRPEIIKLSPIIRFLHKTRRPYFMIHTGQHYSFEMDKLFFKELNLPLPKYRLRFPSEVAGLHGAATAFMLSNIETILLKEKPGVVLVQGDTNSVLAGALAVAKIAGTRLGHVEAGLRSRDNDMPEESNRIIADHVSDFLFAPTAPAKQILLSEGISARKVFVTGNTIVDAVNENLKIASQKTDLTRLTGGSKEFFLMTLHRQENVDDKKRLISIFEGLDLVTRRYKMPLIFPIHPRTKARLERFGLRVPGAIRLMRPAGFLGFLRLEQEAGLILSDSGGVQEEACILKVPCVTLRTTTERPETVEAGGNVIAGFHPKTILSSAGKMLSVKRNWKNPFGDGKSGERIIKILETRV